MIVIEQPDGVPDGRSAVAIHPDDVLSLVTLLEEN
jgi:hypothetical protein